MHEEGSKAAAAGAGAFMVIVLHDLIGLGDRAYVTAGVHSEDRVVCRAAERHGDVSATRGDIESVEVVTCAVA